MSHKLSIVSVVLAAAALLLTGCGKKSAPRAGGGPSVKKQNRPTAMVSAEKTSFKEVGSHLDTGGNLYVYMSTENWLSNASKYTDNIRDMIVASPDIGESERVQVEKGFKMVTDSIADSGVGNISGFGMSSIARDKGLYFNKAVLHRYADSKGGGMWTVFGKRSHDLDGVKMLPKSTALAGFTDFDVNRVWRWINKTVEGSGFPQIQEGMDDVRMQMEAMGVDLDKLLASLAGEMGIIITINEEKKYPFEQAGMELQLPDTAVMILIKVKDSTIFDYFDGMLPPGVVKVDTDTMKMRSMPMPFPVPMHLEPTLALTHNYLVIATNPDIVTEAFAVLDGTKDGLTKTDEFRQMARGVPKKGVNFHFISKRFTDTFNRIMSQAMRMNDNPQAQKMLSQMFGQDNGLYSFGVTENRADGYYFTGNSNVNIGKVMLIQGTIAPTAIMAGMMLPVLSKARGKARRINCAANLKQIGLACLMYSGDHAGDFPNSMDVLDKEQLLVAGKVYGCPDVAAPATQPSMSDYVYVGKGVNDGDEGPTITIVAYDKPTNHKLQWINILFLDGHVQGIAGASIEEVAGRRGWIIGNAGR